MQKDLILGAWDNYEYGILAPWINSIKLSGFTGDIILVCFNSSYETVDKLIEKGVHVIACGKDDEHKRYVHESNMPIHTERFFHFFNVLKEQAVNYRYVIMTDVKDVIFQSNPSLWLEEYLPIEYDLPNFVASSESIRYKDEPWGNQNIEQCFGSYFHDYFKNNLIYNVGVVAGEALAIRDICLNIFLMSINRPIKIVDQAVWNAMLYTNAYIEKGYFPTSGWAWAAQLGTTMDPRKIEQFRPFLTEPEPKIVDKLVVNSLNMPYIIVHQWDRVPELVKIVLEKYGEK